MDELKDLFDIRKYSSLYNLVNTIIETNPISKPAILKNIKCMSQNTDYLFEANKIMQICIILAKREKISLEEIGKYYQQIVFEFLQSHHYFKKVKEYESEKSFENIKKNIYNNDKYMRANLFVLLITYVVWVNKNLMARFFKENFLPMLDNKKTLCEVGVGHGYFFSEALLSNKNLLGIAYDVSAFAISMTKKMLKLRNIPIDKYILRNQNIMKTKMAVYDAIILSEVIEHVKDPVELLNLVKSIVKNKDTPIFFSTTINMISPAHIIFFKNRREIDSLLEDNGFCIDISKVYTPLNELDKTDNELEKNRTPRVYAAIIRNRKK